MIPATDDPASDWTEPGVYQVLPGVHRIPLPLPNDGLRAVNVYAIEDDGGLVLIDAGWALAESRDRLKVALGALGCGLGDVRRFLVTHIHRDHYTQAVVLRREFGTRVGLGRGERESLRVSAERTRPLGAQVDTLRRCGASVVADRLLAGARDGARDTTVWEEPDDWLDDGADVAVGSRTLRAVSTPGHTRGHLVFADRDAGVLFAGDHVLPHITPSIGFEPVPGELPLRDYLGSLRLVRTLPDARLLPAHGPAGGGVHARVDELLAHHDIRLDAAAGTVEGGVDQGGVTAYESARTLRWTRRERHFDDLDPFNQMLAVTETAAHLDLLVTQGRLRASTAEGVTTYSAG